MLSEILNLIQGETQQQVANNPDIANEHSDQVAQIANESVTNTMQSTIGAGGLQSILGLLSGKGEANQSNPIVNTMITQVATKLIGNMGMQPQAANGMAASLIPSILNQVAAKSNNPADQSMDINSIIGGLLGQQTQVGQQVQVPGQQGIDFAQIVSSLSGANPAAANPASGGGFDISQLAGMLGGQGSQQSSGEGDSQAGGMMDMLGGLLGGK